MFDYESFGGKHNEDLCWNNVIINDSIYEDSTIKNCNDKRTYHTNNDLSLDISPTSKVDISLLPPTDLQSKYRAYGSKTANACYVYPRTGARDLTEALLPCAQIRKDNDNVKAITWLRPNDDNEIMYDATFSTVEDAYRWIDHGRSFSNPVGALDNVKNEVF